MEPLRVAVVVGSRADHGPLRPLMRGLMTDDRFQLITVVCTGSSPELDEAVRYDIALDGIDVDARVPIGPQSTGARGVTESAGLALLGMGAALDGLRPDVAVILGDRFEILATAMAAHLLRIPIVHLSGGDTTAGSLDDAMRHAISRLAHLHLTSNSRASMTLESMGEPVERIIEVGSTALDALTTFTPLDREALEQRIGGTLDPTVVAVAYHPATLASEQPGETLVQIVTAIREVAAEATVVITGSNADEGGAEVDAAARRLAAGDDRVVAVSSLGSEGFWSLLHHAAALVGNSSAGLIEAPLLGVPVVDVGARQAGRLRSDRTIHADVEADALGDAIRSALSQGRVPHASPYGDGHAVGRVLEVLASLGDPEGLLSKVPR